VEEEKMYVMTTRRALDPFQNLRRLNSLLDDAFAKWPAQPDENGALTASWAPVCDVFEDRDSVKIVAEIPGVRPEDVKISIENQVLTIRGEKKQVAEEKTERVHRYERSYGLFERSFALPNLVDADKVEAKYDNGILTVTLPKAERARPREISVKVG
jgi:HSP20 family protein